MFMTLKIQQCSHADLTCKEAVGKNQTPKQFSLKIDCLWNRHRFLGKINKLLKCLLSTFSRIKANSLNPSGKILSFCLEY